jgi:hypothetical protein
MLPGLDPPDPGESDGLARQFCLDTRDRLSAFAAASRSCVQLDAAAPARTGSFQSGRMKWQV